MANEKYCLKEFKEYLSALLGPKSRDINAPKEEKIISTNILHFVIFLYL